MKSLRPNLVKRIERLPKPTNIRQAMQPLFEAVSNALHATNARFGDEVAARGRVAVTITTGRNKQGVKATVSDNGPGLDRENWDAFTTTDTDHKILTGGKGVGRLMWLDCFESIAVASTSRSQDGGRLRRSFTLELAPENQIRNLREDNAGDDTSGKDTAAGKDTTGDGTISEDTAGEDTAGDDTAGKDTAGEAGGPGETGTGFCVTLKGLRDNGYRSAFPSQNTAVFQHFTSHFLPTFIAGNCPKVSVTIGRETREYPGAISDIVHRSHTHECRQSRRFGKLSVTMMECDRMASADLPGMHFVHLIAHDRTVHSHCIDSKLGLGRFGPERARVFHAIITGVYLDRNVNQARTAFTFEDLVIARIVKHAVLKEIETFLAEPLSAFRGEQRTTIAEITQTYPSVAFGDVEDLQNRVPPGEKRADAIYGHLARERFRRDRRQAESIRDVLRRLKDGPVDAGAFNETLAEAGRAIESAERQSLAEYVVRRKVVLDFINILLQKVRDDTRDASYQREDVLHALICPLKASTIAGDGGKLESATSHDLWIVDERLTFAKYFSSDVELCKLSGEAESAERPDVLIFDHVHALRQSEGNHSKVLLVEFKRPGRTDYEDNENPLYQVERYVERLQSGGLVDVRGRPIALKSGTEFYCYIVADIVGKMNRWTYSWKRKVNDQGRIYIPDGGFFGSIEVMSWDQLLSDARERNQAFFDKAGITGQSFFGESKAAE